MSFQDSLPSVGDGLPEGEESVLRDLLEQETLAEEEWLDVRFPEGGVWLLCSAVVALHAGDTRDVPLEIAVAGPDRACGALSVLGLPRLLRLRAWRGGLALWLPPDRFKARRPDLPVFVRRMELAAASEVRLLAAAFARHCHGSATQRVAAYLLDRHVATDDLIIANRHQSAAASLGLRRATVTLALHELEALRAIEARRGSIEILDAAVLEEAALNLPPGRPALR